ncbi:DNA-binding domain-containing protein [Variovorax sp. LjRoot84]|uniref:HvfC/BufC family peptide modification chaperone n=1 Tax=Variovorax sp. LjRoot84 TaxID=3342340 RepID=UPI003ED0558E
MPSLHDVQHAMRCSLLQDGEGPAADLIVGAGLAPAQRLSIYRNTMVATLANALRLSFPAVHRLVGADFFEGAAQIFVRDKAPRCADLNAYGAEFPDFLQRFEPAATLAYLPDVARLEWAVNRALHAPDADPLTVERLATVAPADHGKVCFTAHPSVSMLRSEFPVDAIWRAVLQQDDEAMAAIDPGSGPVCLLVQRLTGEVEVERLDEGAWRFTAALFEGRPLDAALAAAEAAGVDAPALLAQHLSAGRLVAFRLAAAEGNGPCREGDTP